MSWSTDGIEVRFSQGMPEGYRVAYYEHIEHYIGEGPDGWETAITCDRWQARRWCIAHSLRGEEA